MGHTDMNQEVDKGEDAAIAAAEALREALATAMLDAAKAGVVGPQGILYTAAFALNMFYQLACKVEGWSDEQARGYLAEALGGALDAPITPDLFAQVRH
jgi:hypothetical protein